MKVIKIICLSGILTIFLSGCWVALPAKGPQGAQKYVGQSCILQRDILIVSYWFTPISWEISEKNFIGKKQKILMTQKAGSKIKIDSIKSFRLPSGVHYAYRCIDLESRKRFDLGFEMRDCLGLSDNK